MTRVAILAAVGVLMSHAVVRGEQPITTATLVRELTSLEALAELRSPSFTCRQFSSYDRASTSPADAKSWFANGDTGQFLRAEDRNGRREFVLADMAGPGAVVRFWSADPKGTLRIYLDEQPAPVIECPLSEWLGGTFPGVPKPIAGEYSKGWNSYFPIAYARHCKITCDQPGFYYHVNYRTYPAGTGIETFERDDIELDRHAIAEAAERLAWPYPNVPRGHEIENKRSPGDLQPGQSQKLPPCAGPAALHHFGMRLLADDIPRALRSTVLSIAFDGETTVVAPIGDFFGAAPGVNEYRTLPLTVWPDGEMIAEWIMPFQKDAVITITNHGDKPVRFWLNFVSKPYTWTDSSMLFHAKWRFSRGVPTRPMIDWNYLTATGQGTFVGVAFNIANPVKAWWGEGDEKIYVDGETFPSHFGTGTEDYFGYAWCWPVRFAHAFHAQPRVDGPGNYGHTAVNRFHILDCIPFQKSFKFDMELWHWHEKCNVDMAVTAYWYARPGSLDSFPALALDNLTLTLLPAFQPFRVAGAIEGEKLRVIEKQGATEPQGIEGCSDESHLWWKPTPKVGDRLVLGFPVEKAGRYRVMARCMSAKDYGIHQLAINDQNAGAARDSYNDGIKVQDEFTLGEFELNAGENRLSVTATGANAKAAPGMMFGLDYLRLEPLK